MFSGEIKMRILYCRVGWMNSYRGSAVEKPEGGGKYNKENIGFEVYNYFGYKGKYYGFVEVGVNKSIHVEKLCGDKADYAEDVLVIWVARKPGGGQVIVGWYENATIYRNLQDIPDEVMTARDLKDHNIYNVFSEKVFLLESDQRNFRIDGMGHSNIWYGDPETDAKVLDYVKSYGKDYEERLRYIEKNLDDVQGDEKEAIVKIRINQDKFRGGLLKKYSRHCCLCCVNSEKLLIASHIKPWAASDSYEKLDLENGLLLCPNHDKLFDSGLISFDDDGKIIISEQLDSTNRIFMNVIDSMKIAITNDNAKYFKYHRENVFVKNKNSH